MSNRAYLLPFIILKIWRYLVDALPVRGDWRLSIRHSDMDVACRQRKAVVAAGLVLSYQHTVEPGCREPSLPWVASICAGVRFHFLAGMSAQARAEYFSSSQHAYVFFFSIQFWFVQMFVLVRCHNAGLLGLHFSRRISLDSASAASSVMCYLFRKKDSSPTAVVLFMSTAGQESMYI
jgi:hypothetical protein